MNRRGSLSARIALLGVAIAVLTGVLAGALAVNLIRSANERSAKQVLNNLANAAQTRVDNGRRDLLTQTRAKQLVLGVLHVRVGELTAQGTFGRKTLPIVQTALTAGQRSALLAGRNVSSNRTVNSKSVYVEGRPLQGGGAIVLVQTRADATKGGNDAIRHTLIAILIGVGTAGVLGVVVAARIARPLRRTAQAAHALAQGRRDVTVEPTGPTEVADVAEAMNALSAALTHSELRQREFLLSVSHDLRTPLTSITGYAESLAGEVVPPDRVAEVGTVMLGEARRLERLVGDLLDLARLDAEDFRIDLAPVDLVDLARGAATVWSQRCAAVGVRFELESTPAVATTDASRLRQVLDGLLENALRVTPAGALIVLAVRTDPDGRACAEIRDGGPGLNDDDLAVAFVRSELFRRYQGVRQVGTGLGLAIVHRLVTRLGASIEAGHAKEGGARFTVRLPPTG